MLPCAEYDILKRERGCVFMHVCCVCHHPFFECMQHTAYTQIYSYYLHQHNHIAAQCCCYIAITVVAAVAAATASTLYCEILYCWFNTHRTFRRHEQKNCI